MFTCSCSSLWTWNLGFTCGLSLCVQLMTGVGLALTYQNESAYLHIEHMESHGGLWSWSSFHSMGATIYFLAMYIHIASSMMSSSLMSYSSWSGGVLYFLSVGMALTGYSLTEGNMAQWALTVVSSVVLNLPAGEFMFPIIVGDYGMSSTIIPSMYATHFLLGLMIPMMVMWHTSEVHHNESSTDLSTSCGPSGKDFITGGGTKDSFMTTMTGLLTLQGLEDSSFLWGLIMDVNSNDWPQQNKTPEPMGPEWYVLPMFAGLKLTSIYIMMVTLGTIILAHMIPCKGYSWSPLAILSYSCCFLLGKLALEAHESLDETFLTAFMMILINWVLMLC